MGNHPLLHVSLSLAPDVQRAYTNRLAASGYRVQFVRGVELEQCLGACQFLLTGRPPRIDWSSASQLRLLQVAGTGVDPLFPASGLRRQVSIANLRGAHEDSVRDHVLALLLAHARKLPRALSQQATQSWSPYTSRPLSDQTLVLLGFGGIGQRVALVARALGMRVVAVRRKAAPIAEADAVYGPDELDTAFASADYAVVCLPLTTKTRGMVSASMIERLPAHATLVNVSRGGIVDQGALERALRAGKLASAALDVFDDEPLPVSNTLWSCPNLIITPHVAGWTESYLVQVLDSFIENVERVRNGLSPRSQVSHEHEY